MSHDSSATSLSNLTNFALERVLHEDTNAKSVTLLGNFPGDVQAIIRLEKTAFAIDSIDRIFSSFIDRVEHEESTDIYTWLFGWFGGKERLRDVKINVISPATDVHVRKYTKQDVMMVQETPDLYERVVKPYIAAFPKSRTKWVDNILSGVSEREKVLYSCDKFIILPDMKWDLTTISALYLVAIVRDESIKSLRDLRRGKRHVELLTHIRSAARHVVKEKWSGQIKERGLRMFIHYQPSYYHFHVHIVNANAGEGIGMSVGQAHLLDDVISMLELEPEEGPGVFEQITLTYGLGDQHGLYEPLTAADISV